MSDDLAARLREQGLRLTPQRELILRAVEELRHATPDEVLAHVRGQVSSVNASTVYRTLEVLEELGAGGMGKVYKGVDKRTGQSVAIKIIDVENADDEVDDIIQEISILSGLNSPYVTKYYGSYLKGSDLWIIMEFCSGGSCSDLMRPGIISEEYVTIILHELLLGLEYLHSDKKLHRDIKGEEISASQPSGGIC